MKIEFNLVQNILNTLPIGYYLGRSIKVELKDENSSYFVPSEDRIVIGFKLIEKAFNNIPEEKKYEYDLEEIIRGLLYHEISHVILTPNSLLNYGYRYNDIINIFEDERIECLLKSFYMNTNFRKNVVFLNRLDENADFNPTTPREAFYNVVRFHRGKRHFINRVAYIIKTYSKINSSSECYVSRYANEIIDLYNDIVRDFENDQKNNRNNESQNSKSNDSSKDRSNSDNANDISESIKDQNNDSNNDMTDDISSDNSDNDITSDNNNNSDNNTDSKSSDNEEGTSSSKQAGDGDENPEGDITTGVITKTLTDEEVDDIIEDLDIIIPIDVKSLVQNALDDSVNKYYDPQLTMRLTQIIEEKLKKQQTNGAAINSYSGRLNVRAVATRDDYKWWAQQNRAGHIKMYSKVHFNLFIDNSGSFSDNDLYMNKFIQSLNKIVDPDFDFDVVTINTQIREWSNTTSRLFKSGGGTHLESRIGEVIKKHTMPRTNNYNIVLFDGDASPDQYKTSNAFAFFDTPNSIIVTDSSNRKYIDAAVKQARVIITKDYCKEFIDAVLTLMERTI